MPAQQSYQYESETWDLSINNRNKIFDVNNSGQSFTIWGHA